MRRELIVFAVIIAVVLTLGLLGRTLVLNTAVAQVKGAFPGYDVSIGSAELRNAGLLALTDIDIKKGHTLRYRIKEVGINFSLFSFFTKAIPKVTLKGPYLEFTAPEKDLKEIIEYPASKPGRTSKAGRAFMARSVVISGLRVALDTADWKLTAEADGDISFGKTVSYKARVKMEDFNLAFLPKGLKAAEKVELAGTMTGEMSLQGEGLKIAAIMGNFSAVAPGGRLVIKDEKLLKKLAENTKQPLVFIEESFRHYDFTEGTLRISKDEDSILFHIMLDGAKGKRDLTVALHGF